jgi:DNA polymerase III delta subunit
MDMWVLHGGDEDAVARRRGALLAVAGQEAERIDIAEEGSEGLFVALESLSLFADRRVISVEHADALSEKDLARLGTIDSDAYVVMRAGTVSAAAQRALTPIATIEKFAKPTGRAVHSRVADIGKENGVTLGSDVVALLAERAGHDLARVQSVCLQLSIVGISKPKLSQVQTLLGSCAPEGFPWGITDALERRDVRAAIAAADEVEPIAALAYLTNQMNLAARVVEAGIRDPREVQDRFGATAFAAGKAMWWVKTVGSRINEALDVLAQADARAKSAVGGRDALVAAVAGLSALM